MRAQSQEYNINFNITSPEVLILLRKRAKTERRTVGERDDPIRVFS